MFSDDSPEMQAALIQAAAILLATGKYTTQDAVDAARCLRAIFRADAYSNGRPAAHLSEVPF